MKAYLLKLMEKDKTGLIIKQAHCNRVYPETHTEDDILSDAHDIFGKLPEGQFIEVNEIDLYSYQRIYEALVVFRPGIGSDKVIKTYYTFEELDVSVETIKLKAEKENRLFGGMTVEVKEHIDSIKTSNFFE